MPLDPQAQALLDKVEQSGILPYERMTPELARKFYQKACEAGGGSPPEVYCVEDMAIPGPAGDLNLRCYRASTAGNLPVLLFFHGGGFTIGSLQSHDAVCRYLCAEAQCLVLSLDYRLAPEHKFPAAVEDAWAATCWLAEHAVQLGADPTRIAVAGDSAGGNLAAVTCLMAREAGQPGICYQVLIYPGTDMTESLASHRDYGEGYLLTSSLISWFHQNYLPQGIDLKTWQGSPLHASDHRDLPPAHVITAGFDPLQDEGRAYAEKLKAAGVPVSFHHYEGMLHGFVTQPGYMEQARAALAECGLKLKQAFSD
ncbi:MAG: alpha/beta hydrolase [Gammaproteobacteria bacterium]